jgi:hypothetical protein
VKINITKKIGKAQLAVQVEGDKEVDTLLRASAFTTMPDRCGLCQSDEVQLDANKAEGFTFIKVRCLKCNATSSMGQYKDGTGCFWNRFEKFERKNTQQSPAQTRTAPHSTTPAPAEVEDDDMPF